MPARIVQSRSAISAWTPRFARAGDSLWSIVHKFAALNGFRGPRTREVLGIGVRFSDCTSAQSVDSASFRILGLGDQVVSAAIAKAFIPVPVEREFGVAQVFNKTLRFCSRCIEVGYHSSLHQLKYVVRCPIHDLPIASVCPRCGREITMSCSDTALKYAYSCRCGHSLLSVADSGGMGAVATQLDTSSVVNWLEWSRSWSSHLVYRDITSICEYPPMYFGDRAAISALNSLWTIRTPVKWQRDWVAFDNREGPSTTRLTRTAKYNGAKDHELIDPALEKDLHSKFREVIRETEKVLRRHHPNCDYSKVTGCPAAEAFRRWAKHWTPPTHSSIAAQEQHHGRVLGCSGIYGRLTWMIDTWEGDRGALRRMSPCLVAHLLRLAMLASLGLELIVVSAQSLDKRTQLRIGAVKDSSVRLLLDVKSATLLTWEPPVIEDIEHNVEMLVRTACHD